MVSYAMLLHLLVAYWASSGATGFVATRTAYRHMGLVEQHNCAASLSSEEIRWRLEENLRSLSEKDRSSPPLPLEELKVVFEDEHILVTEKPAGILSGPRQEEGVHTLLETVHEHVGDTIAITRDRMAVHRLGRDTSGLMVYAKSQDAMRGLNMLFRTRKITRQYEVLVAGHVQKDQGFINLPIMRCYECPPYMRVATDEQQRYLLTLDAEVVGKKLLEAPKASFTHFQVVAREELGGNPSLQVTRMILTSITGRTHQLNVHCAAFGHPIIGDKVYGYGGCAVRNGGMETTENSVPESLQKDIDEAMANQNMCVHAQRIQFEHPCTGEQLEFKSKAPF